MLTKLNLVCCHCFVDFSIETELVEEDANDLERTISKYFQNFTCPACEEDERKYQEEYSWYLLAQQEGDWETVRAYQEHWVEDGPEPDEI